MNWNVIAACAAVLFSVVSYILTRRNELAWKRTEFLCAQSQYLDNDPELVEVMRIIEGRHPDITVGQVFDEKSDIDNTVRWEYRQKFDKMLNLLWRLCYAYSEVKTLSRKEIEGFGWYFWRVSQFPSLVAYCQDNGYYDINSVTSRLGLDRDD